jgi:hypothetical protein
MRICWYCGDEYVSQYDDNIYFHMSVQLLGVQRGDVDSEGHDVCNDCFGFIDTCCLKCYKCDTTFDSIEALKGHILRNMVPCNRCQEVEICSDSWSQVYKTDTDYVYVCDTCNNGALTKRAN